MKTKKLLIALLIITIVLVGIMFYTVLMLQIINIY